LGYLFNSIIKKMCGTNIEGFRSLTEEEEGIIDKIITGEIFTMRDPEIGSLNSIYGTIGNDKSPESPCDSKKYCYYVGKVRGSDGLYPGLPAFKTYKWDVKTEAVVDDDTSGPIPCEHDFDCCKTSSSCTRRLRDGSGSAEGRAKQNFPNTGITCKPQQCSVKGSDGNFYPADCLETGVCPSGAPKSGGNDENNQKENKGEKNRVVVDQVTCDLSKGGKCPGPIRNGNPTSQDCPPSEVCPLLCTDGTNAINVSDKEKNYQCDQGWVPRTNTYYTPSTDPKVGKDRCCIETCDNWIKRSFKGKKCPAGSRTRPGTIPFDSKGIPQPEKCCEYATEEEIINNNGEYVCDPEDPKSKCLLCNEEVTTGQPEPYKMDLGAIHGVSATSFKLSERLSDDERDEFKINMDKWSESEGDDVYGLLNGVNVNWEIRSAVPDTRHPCSCLIDSIKSTCWECGDAGRPADTGNKSYMGPGKKCVTRDYLKNNEYLKTLKIPENT